MSLNCPARNCPIGCYIQQNASHPNDIDIVGSSAMRRIQDVELIFTDCIIPFLYWKVKKTPHLIRSAEKTSDDIFSYSIGVVFKKAISFIGSLKIWPSIFSTV